jgi:beta-lactamase class A
LYSPKPEKQKAPGDLVDWLDALIILDRLPPPKDLKTPLVPQVYSHYNKLVNLEQQGMATMKDEGGRMRAKGGRMKAEGARVGQKLVVGRGL